MKTITDIARKVFELASYESKPECAFLFLFAPFLDLYTNNKKVRTAAQNAWNDLPISFERKIRRYLKERWEHKAVIDSFIKN